MKIEKNRDLKDLYRIRVQQIIISTVAWSMLIPYLQVAYHNLTPTTLGLLTMSITLAGSFQQFFGKLFSLKVLFLALIFFDSIMIIINPILLSISIKYWVAFDIVAGAPYALTVGLLISKLSSITIKRYKPYAFTSISNRVMEIKFRGNLLGMAIGTLMAYLNVNLFNAIIIQDLFLVVLVFTSIKAYKKLP